MFQSCSLLCTTTGSSSPLNSWIITIRQNTMLSPSTGWAQLSNSVSRNFFTSAGNGAYFSISSILAPSSRFDFSYTKKFIKSKNIRCWLFIPWIVLNHGRKTQSQAHPLGESCWIHEYWQVQVPYWGSYVVIFVALEEEFQTYHSSTWNTSEAVPCKYFFINVLRKLAILLG